MNAAVLDFLPAVHASLNYIEASREKPRSLEYDPPPGVARTTAVYREQRVAIRDLRPLGTSVSVDREGFQLVTAPTRVRNFNDEEQIRSTYYSEAEDLLRRLTGANRVVVFDHTIRRRIAGADDRARGIPRQPVPRVHNDYTERSGPQRVRDILGAEADELLRRRFAIINLWRPLRGPVRDAPLAVADARSIAAGDLVATDLVYPDRLGEIYYVKANPAHSWYYAPAMDTDEVLLIKCFDSARDGTARFAPHSSFTDPGTPKNAPPRESIELRTLVFFP